MNRLRVGPLKRSNGPVRITRYDAAGNVIETVEQTPKQIEERRRINSTVEKLSKEEQMQLLAQLTGAQA